MRKEILEKAIQKAIDGGWTEDVTGIGFMSHTEGYYFTSGETEFDIEDLYPLIIFNHDFARALWGEEESIPVSSVLSKITKTGWERHLQQMVIAEDPIRYLGENI